MDNHIYCEIAFHISAFAYQKILKHYISKPEYAQRFS